MIYLVLTLILCGLSLYLAYADPQGATISGTPDVDNGPNRTADSRTDDGGVIVTINLDLEQQTDAWKAYVGNVTGKYVLQNGYNYSIYEWPSGGTVEGEVYITRSNAINFSNVSCATNARMLTEQGALGLPNNVPYNINNTFNTSVNAHKAFSTAGTPFAQGACRALATWVNNTKQDPSPTADFQEVALHDGTNFIYTSLINDNSWGFEVNNATYDFQAIVAENESSSGTTYYFYIELGP